MSDLDTPLSEERATDDTKVDVKHDVKLDVKQKDENGTKKAQEDISIKDDDVEMEVDDESSVVEKVNGSGDSKTDDKAVPKDLDEKEVPVKEEKEVPEKDENKVPKKKDEKEVPKKKDEKVVPNGDERVNGENHDDVKNEEESNDTGSRRSSPRKAALNARAAAAAQEMSDDEKEEASKRVTKVKEGGRVTKVKDFKKVEEVIEVPDRTVTATTTNNEGDDDEDSSDSIVELEAEDPLGDPLSGSKKVESEKRKTSNGATIVTLDDVKAIQNLAKQQQKKPDVTIIDPSKILAGKTSGVTITPAQARPVHSSGTNLGYGISISRTTLGTKSLSSSVASLPAGITISSLGSGFSPRPGGGLGYASVQPHTSLTPPQAKVEKAIPVDPNLTDDMFVLEAPSFVVPYVYEKPAKESFKDFKESLEKIIQDLQEKAKIEKKKEEEKEDVEMEDKDKETKEKEDVEMEDKEGKEKEEGDKETKEKEEGDKEAKEEEKEKKADEVTVVPVPKPAPVVLNPYFETSVGKFVVDLGMNMVQEMVQQDLLKELTKKSAKDKSAQMMRNIASLKSNLEDSKKRNKDFHLEMVKCPRCAFETESEIILANHQETLHVKNGFYRCSFCRFDTMHMHEVVHHMKNVHGINSRMEKPLAHHQCPQCEFEDSNKGKFTRHKMTCDKRFRADRNQAPSYDWEPPAKMPKVTALNRGPPPPRPNNIVTPTFNGLTGNNWQGSSSNNSIHSQLRNIPAGMPNYQVNQSNRGNPTAYQQQGYRPVPMPLSGSSILRQGNNQIGNNQGRFQYAAGSSAALLSNLASNSSVTIQSVSQRNNSASMMRSSPASQPQQQQYQPRPGQPRQQGKGGFVICEICDGYIKDLEQLKNHMSWIHKIKIHPKMIYQRPPLNCQKCQFRFFTDQGLERHLLGTHGLVTASMQDLATKGQDSGRCPICGKVYQWKLLNHVAKDHQKTLKPAHLSYKCTVCEATFCQYKLFETHVYSTHGAGNKKAATADGSQATSSSSTTASTPTSSGANLNKEQNSGAKNVSKKESPKSLLKCNNSVDDVIELDDDEMEEDEDSVQSIPGKDSSDKSSSDEPKSRNAKSEEEVEEISDDD